MNISCIILAGGKGLRFGQDKVLETVSSRSLVEEVVFRVSPFSSEIIIVTARGRTIPQITSQPKPIVVGDTIPGKGPLGGIYTGLITSTSYHNLVVACDMPFLNQDLLRYMLRVATDFDLVVPKIDNLVEPLHAVYAKSCLVPIEAMIEQGNLSVHKLMQVVNLRYVEAQEIDLFDPEHLSFFNINTKADLKKAKELALRIANDD